MEIKFTEKLAKPTLSSKIKVDPRLKKRISTNVEFVDMVKSGDAPRRGLVPGEVVLFTGTPGAGKTTLCLQMAEAMSSTKSNRVLLNSCEESPAQLALVIERLGGAGRWYASDATFVDPPNGDKELKKMVGSNILASHIEAFVADARKKKQQPIVFIDSLQTLNDGKYGSTRNKKTEVRCLLRLIELAKKHYCPIVVIGQVSKSGNFAGSNTLLHAVDSHLHIYIDEHPKSETYGYRILECRKNRFGPTGIGVALDIGPRGLKFAMGGLSADQ